MNALITILLLSTTLTYPRVDSNMPLFSQSAASVNNVVAGLVNPAGLAFGNIMGLRFMHAFTDSSLKGDDGIILASRSSLASVQWIKYPNGKFRRKYLMAAGNRLFPKFYWGLSFAWYGGADDEHNEIKYNKKKFWQTGFIFIPRNDVSLGLVIDNFNRPDLGALQTERIYTLAAAYFLSQRKFIISTDIYYQEKDKLKDMEMLFRIEIKPFRKLRLVGDYMTAGYYQTGMAYRFEYIEIGLSARFYKSDFIGGNFYYDQGPIPMSR